MANRNERDHGRDGQPDEDTQAILNRRRFLIASALAGAGLGAVAAGCDPDSRPDVCLEVKPEPGPCLSLNLPEKKPGTKPTTGEPAPPPGARRHDIRAGICLSIRRPKICLKITPPKPKPCLSVKLPKPRPKPKTSPKKPGPRPCLSPPRPKPKPKPKTSPKKPEPRPCLSPPRPKPEPKPKTSPKKPEPRPCLSPPRPKPEPKPKTSPKKPEPRPCLSPREP